MSTPETVYDSDDATEMQLKRLSGGITENLSPTDFETPQMVQMLFERELVHLTELKALKVEMANLRSTNASLRDERTKLLIDNAKMGQRESTSWIEIPIGILSGFAINILTQDYKNGLGWALLILSVLILLFLRLPQLITIASRVKGSSKEETNA